VGRRAKPLPGARALNGWLVLDKPAGLSSARAVAAVRAALRPMRIGHAGTLDPLATGVLPLALGEATKTVGYAMAGEKAYRFTLRFGERRSTDDAEGAVVETSAHRPADAALAAALPRFIGAIDQVPPAYSAVRLGGRRAYARARAGEAVTPAARRVVVRSLRLIVREGPEEAVLELVCGKGTYVRSLARDLAQALGTVGHVAALRRTRVGPFTEDMAIPLAKLPALGHSAAEFGHLLPVETALDDIPALAVTGEEAAAIRQGRPVRVLGAGGPGPRETGRELAPTALSDGTVVCAMDGTRPVALARYVAGEVRPVRVLNL